MLMMFVALMISAGVFAQPEPKDFKKPDNRGKEYRQVDSRNKKDGFKYREKERWEQHRGKHGQCHHHKGKRGYRR